jgi:NIMA (never in mitosis gene a)-related kinase
VGTLAKHVAARRSSQHLLSEQLLLNWLLQLLMALDHIHKKGIVHRAIGLQSVMIQENAHVKLANFALPGLPMVDQRYLKGYLSDREYCLSPELCRGDGHYTNKCDIWSVGCVIWGLTCLEYPYEGKSLAQLTRNILTKQLPTERIPGCYSQNFIRIMTSKILNKD